MGSLASCVTRPEGVTFHRQSTGSGGATRVWPSLSYDNAQPASADSCHNGEMDLTAQSFTELDRHL